MRRYTRQSIVFLIILLGWSTAAPGGLAHAQEGRVRFVGFLQGHTERVETIVNGKKQSFDLVEPSFGIEAAGMLFSPKFLIYEGGFSFLKSDLDGTEFELESEDVNYNGIVTLFPGRRLSLEALGRRVTDELQDNLFLFNRVRIQEIGGRGRLLQGGRLPSLLVSYLQRDQDTTTAFNEFDQNSKDFDIQVDRRSGDLHYHLGFRRSEFESKDFGYKAESNLISASVFNRLATHLTGEAYANYNRTETTFGRRSLDSAPVVDAPLRRREQTELRAGLGLHYRRNGLRGDGDYEYMRIEEELLETTRNSISLRGTYQPSSRTTFDGRLSARRSDSTFASSLSSNLSLRMTRDVRPNLVFFIEGESRISRSDEPSLPVSEVTSGVGGREFTVNDLRAGLDYTRMIGNFSTLSSILLSVGSAQVSPGESGNRRELEARISARGRVYGGIDLSMNFMVEDRNDDSSFSSTLNQAQAQIVAIRRLGPRLQLRGSLFALRLKEEPALGFIVRTAATEPDILDITQTTTELGVSFFLRRNIFGRALVGYTKSTSLVEGQEERVTDTKYFDASLHAVPVRGLDLLARIRIQRGSQPVEVQSDQNFAELNASYRLRSWQVLLGYSTNQIILGSTDLEQNRVFLTVRRNFAGSLF